MNNDIYMRVKVSFRCRWPLTFYILGIGIWPGLTSWLQNGLWIGKICFEIKIFFKSPQNFWYKFFVNDGFWFNTPVNLRVWVYNFWPPPYLVWYRFFESMNPNIEKSPMENERITLKLSKNTPKRRFLLYSHYEPSFCYSIGF